MFWHPRDRFWTFKWPRYGKGEAMCLQCLTESRTFMLPNEWDVLPHYSLQVATKDHELWPKGWYGLVRVNDPEFVFPLNLEPKDEDEKFDAVVEVLEKLKGPLGDCYDLLMAAMAVGFVPVFKESQTEDSFPIFDIFVFAEWLYCRLVAWIKTHPLDQNVVQTGHNGNKDS